MKRVATVFFVLAIGLFGISNSTQAQSESNKNRNVVPIYQIKLVGNSVTAISYQHRSGSTEIGFKGTPLLLQASGHAKVESKQGRLEINAEFKDLVPAQNFGPEYLTYVLWAITPEGKANNLGEILLDGKNSKIDVTSSLQTFGLIVTAEPYFAVSQPSNVVILENVVLPSTVGTIDHITAKYELLDRGQYSYAVSEENRNVVTKMRVPLEVYEARNAVAIARSIGAEQYAPGAFSKAQNSLQNAEGLVTSKGNRKQEIQAARDAVQNAADARQISVRRIESDRAESERAEAARREEKARADAADATARQQREQVAKERAELEKQQAELQKQQAQQKADQEAQARANADAENRAAQEKAQQEQAAAAQARDAATKAQDDAARAQDAAARAIQEQQQLRAALLLQFNRILPTTDTPRGLKVNMSDVLFATSKYDLRENAREALAKLAGIIASHPGLRLQIDGYTDSTGGDAFNLTLSENRANSVRAYLLEQGIDPNTMASAGFGKANPVASNDTPVGRQLNRRVEIMISGQVIGVVLGSNNQNNR